MSTEPAPRKVVVLSSNLGRNNDTSSIVVALTAGVVSVVAHLVLILLMMSIPVGAADATAADVDVAGENIIDDTKKEEPDLSNVDIGQDSSVLTQFNSPRIEDISVPGPEDATAAVGMVNAPEAPQMTLPAPPGVNNGVGGAPKSDEAGFGAMFGGKLGGMDGLVLGGFGGRSGATRVRLLQEGGGNAVSEAAVARGLKWLALHQAADGHWSLDSFNRSAREKPYPAGKTFVDDSNGLGASRNDIAGTALALLPFLAGGQTHKPAKDKAEKKDPLEDYSKGIDAGLKFLVGKQGKDGYFGGDMYSHGLAAIAMCEAYGLTGDPVLKVPAQRSIDYLIYAQDPSGGGWRYEAKSPGDTSVTGWAVMALKSGQMAGLNVPATATRRAEKFLDKVESRKGGFSYLPGDDPKPSMTAVGLLCRQYLQQVNPKNPALQQGIKILKENAPGKTGDLYYEYYATQVLHHFGGESWKFWNEGADGKSGIRDTLIAKQDAGTTKKGNAGSWAPTGPFGPQGGRIMETSLSLLCLEVYYRHLPLYRREMEVRKGDK